MIELKNVKKMYRPKKGPSVQALKGVSLKLEDKGLVFILGKSGSGKSTLLNVMGGLDSYDEGEIIIKNKSSKDFTQSEFDSYRNTFIGFIFQEYNILNEFTVGQNIALAIELQGKKATSEEVNSILDEVDLADYANRKPNELSGGQKQRVAIARALIKKPEIIMADEPTGALDSNTGKMIFDTLKKLSETKLVVVVSHDRDFAEQFGDRVIELADGEIVSDIYKHTITPDSKSVGVSVVDEKLIHIKKGYSLTAEDLKLIYDYIKKNEQDTYISLDSKTNDEVKRIARITDDGNREAFRETSDEELTLKDYNPEDCKFIKSRLPYKKAIKIGASGLKTKPFRLFMTIILSAVAFCLFGIAMTAADYDKINTARVSMVNEKVNYMSIGKEYVNNSDNFSYTQSAQLTDADIETLKAKFGDDLVAVYTGEDTYFGNYDYAEHLKDRSKIQNTMGSSFYQPIFSGLVEITEAQLDKLGYTLEGKLPTADNEIAVTNYALDIFKLCGYNSTTNSTINGFSELRNKKIILNDRITGTQIEYVIVGVVDTKFNSSRYESMMPSSDNDSMDTGSTISTQNSLGSIMLSQELTAVLQYSLHAAAFVNQGTISELESMEKYRPNSGYINVYFSDNQSNEYISTTHWMNFNYLCPKKAIADGSYVLFNGGTTLGDNDILISPQSFANWCSSSGNDELIDFASQIPEKRNSFYDYLINNEDVVWKYIDGGAPLAFDYFNKTNESGEYNFKLTFTQSETGNLKLVDVYHIDATGDYYLSGYDSNGMPIYNLLSTATLYSYNEETGTYFEDADGDYIRVDEVSYDLVSNNRYSKDKEYQQIYNYEDISADTVRYTFSYVKDTDGDYTLNLSVAQQALVDLLIGTGYESNPYGNSGKEIYAHIVKESLAGYSGAVPACPVYMHYSNYLENENTTTTMNIVGLYFGSDGDVVLSDKKIESLALQVGGMYSCVVGALPTGDKFDELLEFWEDDGIESSNYTLNNSVTVALTGVGSYLESFTTVFLYIGLGCALFASFLLMTFISTSISYKKSEIGILRAVGARSADVVNIFFNEALIIALINFTVALIGTAIAVSSINTTLKATFNLALTLMNFGVLQALYMLLIAIGAAFLASSIPVFLTARKKPIDAIRSR